jgi:hypothetical protein
MVLAALVPAFLAAAEIGLRLMNRGQPREADLPQLGFAASSPLFEVDASGTHYHRSPARRDFFRPASFPVVKAPGSFRIFCVGGSTVQGRPYATETAFPQWLELGLETVAPERNWEVINCGGISYASHRLLPIVEEVAGYDADLLVIYTGHNEFLEERVLHDMQQPISGARLRNLGSWLHLVNVLRVGFRRAGWVAAPGRVDEDDLALNVATRLDQEGGWASYRRDEALTAAVRHAFESNLRRMIKAASRARVPVLLVDPVSNLKDCPPFKVEPGPLPEAERRRFDELYRRAALSELSAFERELLLEEAVELDPLHAGAWYRLGQCRLVRGKADAAREALILARDTDVCPLRATTSLHAAISRCADLNHAFLVPGRTFFEHRARDRVPGRECLVDHVHPTIEAHQDLACLLLEHLKQQGVVTPPPDWETRCAVRFREHLSDLEPTYFVRGLQRLERLRRWSRGLEARPGDVLSSSAPTQKKPADPREVRRSSDRANVGSVCRAGASIVRR